MELFDYQKDAVKFMAKSKRSYLALDMGMGKTLTSLASVENVSKKHVLLIAEKNEIVNSQNFKKEIASFFKEKLSYINAREVELPTYDKKGMRCVCGINPDGLKKLDKKFIEKNFDSIIMDEATLAKTTTSQRFKLIKKITDKMKNVILLSGTPMMNGASELYAPLLLMEHPMVFGKGAKGKKAFEKIFAGGHDKLIRKLPPGYKFSDLYGRLRYQRWKYLTWWAKGANNVRELRHLLKDSFFILNKNETDVFQKKERAIKKIPMSLKWTKEYEESWDDYFKEQKTSRTKIQLDNIKEIRTLIENGKMYQVNSKWKAKQVAKDISKGVYGKNRIVVFSLFVETDELLQKELGRLKISFRTFEEVQEWKEGDEQVLVGRIKAHGKGTNLPEANVCLFTDMDFVPANNIQAENRIDRPEQKKEMLVNYYLTEGDSVIDNHVRKINQQKTKKIKKFMAPLTKEEIKEMPKRLQAIREKYPLEADILGI